MTTGTKIANGGNGGNMVDIRGNGGLGWSDCINPNFVLGGNGGPGANSQGANGSGGTGFQTGQYGTSTWGTQLSWQQEVSIVGSAARVDVERPLNPEAELPTSLRIIRGDLVEERTLPPAAQYVIMVERFSRAILEGTPVPTPLEDAVANMKVLDAMRA